MKLRAGRKVVLRIDGVDFAIPKSSRRRLRGPAANTALDRLEPGWRNHFSSEDIAARVVDASVLRATRVTYRSASGKKGRAVLVGDELRPIFVDRIVAAVRLTICSAIAIVALATLGALFLIR